MGKLKYTNSSGLDIDKPSYEARIISVANAQRNVSK